MGRLDEVVDMTGKMSQMDLNAQNIQQVIAELNRNSDQLDAITNSFNIIGRGSTTLAWDGSSALTTVSAIHGSATTPLFMCAFTRSDQPGLSFIPTMYWFDNTGICTQRVYVYANGPSIFFQFANKLTASAANFVFSWYIMSQPANIPTGS